MAEHDSKLAEKSYTLLHKRRENLPNRGRIDLEKKKTMAKHRKLNTPIKK